MTKAPPAAHDAEPGRAPARPGVDRAGLVWGLVVAVGCTALALTAYGYGIGAPRRMGPGFFPFYLGLIGAALGAAMTLRAVLAPTHRGEAVPTRRLLFICAAFLLFALALRPLGLVLTVIGATLLGAFADRDARPAQSLLLALGLALAIWVVFVVLLGLPIPVLPGER